jgi:hypothetical protein
MTTDELKHFLGLKYNKILEINLKKREKVLYGKLKQIVQVKQKAKSHDSKSYSLNFDIIKDVDTFRKHRENRKFVKSQELQAEDIDSIGVIEL